MTWNCKKITFAITRLWRVKDAKFRVSISWLQKSPIGELAWISPRKSLICDLLFVRPVHIVIKSKRIQNLTYPQWWRGHGKGVVSFGIADTSDTGARHRETGSPWCSPYPRRWISSSNSNVLRVLWSSWTSICHCGSSPHPAHAPWKNFPLLEIRFAKRWGIRRDLGLICRPD